MKPEFELLHRDMLSDIQRVMQLDLPEAEKVDSCFWIAIDYWEKLKDRIKTLDFSSNEEEIDFFKNVKPHFTCYIEFFVLVSEALLFVSKGQMADEEFWREEINRSDRYCVKKFAFVDYYKSGDSYMDATYFLRENNLVGVPIAAPPYDVELEFCTSHDPLIRTYLAYKMYEDYCVQNIQQLEKRG